MISKHSLSYRLGREITDAEYPLVARWWHSRSLDAYREYIAGSGHSDFTRPHAAHHKIMASALERVASGECKRLIIQLPPGAAKSTITSVQFATWYWALYPDRHILRCSAIDSLARNFSRRNLSAVMSPEWQQLSGVALDKKQQSVVRFANDKGGTMTAAGVGSSIIGLRSHLSILDDPVVSFDQINSETRRQSTIDWYFAEYRSRLIPGGAEVIVTTRWHAQDIVGHILDSEEADTWEVIRIPMVCDSDDDPLGREIGERLWTEWFTEQQVREAMRNPMHWAGMYQQTPLTAEGDWLNADDIQVVDKAPANLGKYAAIDIAMSEGKGDFTVITVAGMAPDGSLYILDVWRDRVSPDKTVERLIQTHRTYELREALIEDDVGAKVFRNLAHKLLMQRRELVPLTPLPTRGNDKETRALAFRGLAKMGGVKMVRAPWNSDVLREVCGFPFSKETDDIVDTLALLGRRVAQMSHEFDLPGQHREVLFSVQERDGKPYTRSTMDELWEDNRPSRNYGTIRI